MIICLPDNTPKKHDDIYHKNNNCISYSFPISRLLPFFVSFGFPSILLLTAVTLLLLLTCFIYRTNNNKVDGLHRTTSLECYCHHHYWLLVLATTTFKMNRLFTIFCPTTKEIASLLKNTGALGSVAFIIVGLGKLLYLLSRRSKGLTLAFDAKLI